MRSSLFLGFLVFFSLAWEAAAGSYADVVRADKPVAWWRFDSAGPNRIPNHGSGRGVDGLVEGEPRLGVAGPRPKSFPDFSSSNHAAAFGERRGFIRVRDVGPGSVLDFGLGDSITLEAWVAPEQIPEGQHFYVVGKGRTGNPGAALNNQNYALRLTGKRGTARISFLFRDHRNSADAHWHRWTAREGPMMGSGWHHVAVTYTFGEDESVRGYVDGVEVKGVWDMGGKTGLGPVVDDDDVWIGSSMGGTGGGRFHGLIDEVAIYRTCLAPARIARRYHYEPVAVVPENLPETGVLAEVLEGIPDRASWVFREPGTVSYEFTLPAFGLTRLPGKYSGKGIRMDWSNPLLVRLTARVRLGAGPGQVLLRSRGGSRLWMDGRLILSTPFPRLNADGHEEVPQVPAEVAPGVRFLQPGDSEQLATVQFEGGEHVFRLESFVGGKGRRLETGELSVSVGKAGELMSLLSPEANVPLTDEGWRTYESDQRMALREMDAVRRREGSKEERRYWVMRHKLAKELNEQAIELPPVSRGVINGIDRFIGRKLEACGVSPAPLVDDWSFLRRASLDTIGIPPTPGLVRAFAKDKGPGRRERAVDRLLKDPRWADHWVSYWQDALAENPGILKPKLNNTGPFRWFIHESFLDNKPMDRFATELIMMEGSRYYGGAAGFALATQNDVPMAAKAQVLAQAFMGMQLQCARCHDAPYHDFLQKDLFSLAAMLKRSAQEVPSSSSIPQDSHVQLGRLVEVTLQPGAKVDPAWPFPDVAPSDLAPGVLRRENDPRERMAALITHPGNERFARVIVNRLWKRYLGWGMVEPVDDWEAAEASHPDLLEFLARELVTNNYDLKHVARLILNSHTYQRRVQPAGSKELEAGERLFASPARRRLTAEQVVDSLFAVAGKSFRSEAMNMDVDGRRPVKDFLNLGKPEHAWEFASLSNERDRPALAMPRAQPILDTLTVFGWRESRQNPLSVRDDSPNILQPASLANGLMAARISRLSDDSALTALCLEERDLKELIEAVVMRIYSRPATDRELQLFTGHLEEGYEKRILAPSNSGASGKGGRRAVSWSNHLNPEATRIKQELEREVRAGDPPTDRLRTDWRERMEDLIWAMVNSPEFVFVP